MLVLLVSLRARLACVCGFGLWLGSLGPDEWMGCTDTQVAVVLTQGFLEEMWFAWARTHPAHFGSECLALLEHGSCLRVECAQMPCPHTCSSYTD